MKRLAATTALVLALAACSTDDDTSTPAPSPATTTTAEALPDASGSKAAADSRDLIRMLVPEFEDFTDRRIELMATAACGYLELYEGDVQPAVEEFSHGLNFNGAGQRAAGTILMHASLFQCPEHEDAVYEWSDEQTYEDD